MKFNGNEKDQNLSTQRHGDTEKSKKPLFFRFVFPLSLFRKALLYLCVEWFVFSS